MTWLSTNLQFRKRLWYSAMYSTRCSLSTIGGYTLKAIADKSWTGLGRKLPISVKDVNRKPRFTAENCWETNMVAKEYSYMHSLQQWNKILMKRTYRDSRKYTSRRYKQKFQCFQRGISITVLDLINSSDRRRYTAMEKLILFMTMTMSAFRSFPRIENSESLARHQNENQGTWFEFHIFGERQNR